MGDHDAPAALAPEGATAVVEDGGVKMLIVKEGTGELPPMHSRCLVHYVGRIAATGEAFMDTRKESAREEPARLVAGRDSILREKGIHLAVAKMRVGERCHVWVSPDYGYGAEGNFSFPAVPGNAALTYDVELLDFEPPADKEQRDMTFEERLEAAERRRVEGNAAFKAGQYTEALGRYSMSLSFIDEDLLMQLQGFHYDKAMATRTPALLNMAACHLKLGDNTAGISAASEVLMRDPDSAKALYRRGAARLALGQSEAAYEDLLRAWKLAPGDAGIAKELAAAKAALRQEREAEKRVFQGVLEKASNGGGLYEEKEGEDAEDSSWEETGAGGSWERRTLAGGSIKPQGWLSGVLQTLCPFIFGRQKQHVA